MDPIGLDHAVCTVDGLTSLPLTVGETISFCLDAAPGLYLFSVVMDARDFDWEQLYETLSKYHNEHERTGPWDFSINFGAIPLVPAYWVALNGRRIGLWFFERVSLEDIAHQRFRGKFSFVADGPTTVELTPYRPEQYVQPSLEDRQSASNAHVFQNPGAPPAYDRSGLRWVSAVLEVEPEDALLPEVPRGRAYTPPAAAWARPEYWERLRAALDTTHALYREPLRRTFEWLSAHRGHGADDLLMWIAAWRLGAIPDALDEALATVDEIIGRPAWGNPNPEGYSHNGDMGAMSCLRALAWAYHALGDELGEERRARLLDKLRVHGQIFFELALLNRDYWGGSISQDHGKKSLAGFGVAALHLLGVLPEADLWCRWVLPRVERSWGAMPRDGVIPLSSHYHQYLYLEETSQYREALLALTGEDVLDRPQFRPIIDFMVNLLSPSRQVLRFGNDLSRFIGAAHFLNQAASKFRDGRAAWLQQQLLQLDTGEFYHGTQLYAYYQSAVAGLMSYDPSVAATPPAPPPPLQTYPDSGLVHYRDDARRVALTLQCGPASGWNSYLASLCACDRLGIAPASGHFMFYLDDVPVLCSPDGGYKLQTALRSCLLIDGQGQVGDIGYPMSIPSKLHRGEQVQTVRWDEVTQTGFVRLWLTPGYPDELGLAHYTRDFLIAPERITVRDTVVLDEPRRLSWLFQGKEEYGVVLEGLTGVFGTERQARVTPQTTDLPLAARVAKTPVVWSYASGSGFKPFLHVRYDATEAVRRVVAEFVISW
ncbi:hypothetical protein LLH23_11015 [bacterium]|nr:hypothetical protein [bacterium]